MIIVGGGNILQNYEEWFSVGVDAGISVLNNKVNSVAEVGGKSE